MIGDWRWEGETKQRAGAGASRRLIRHDSGAVAPAIRGGFRRFPLFWDDGVAVGERRERCGIVPSNAGKIEMQGLLNTLLWSFLLHCNCR